MLGSQLSDTSLGLLNVTTPLQVPCAPGVEIPFELSTPLEIMNEDLNHQTPISNRILFQNINQNTVTGIQNFTNHTPCIEYVYNYIIILLKLKYI